MSSSKRASSQDFIAITTTGAQYALAASTGAAATNGRPITTTHLWDLIVNRMLSLLEHLIPMGMHLQLRHNLDEVNS